MEISNARPRNGLQMEVNSTTVVYELTNTTRNNTNQNADDEKLYFIIAVVGCGFFMAAMALSLITFITSGQLRVKRPHMIAFNLCVSLTVFYVGVVTSLVEQYNTGQMLIQGCIIGAIFIAYGLYLTWAWLVVHWFYLVYTATRSSTPHISNFFFKVAIPTYTIPTIWLTLVSIVKLTPNFDFVDEKKCLFEMDVVMWAFSGVYLFICVVICVYCCTANILIVTYKKPTNVIYTKTKRTVLGIKRLSAMSFSIITCTICTALLHVYKDDIKKSKAIHATYGVMSAVFGISIALGLVFRSPEFQIHWKSLILGRNPAREQSLHRTLSRVNSLSTGRNSPMRHGNILPNQQSKLEKAEHRVSNASPKYEPREPATPVQEFDDIFDIPINDNKPKTQHTNSLKDFLKQSDSLKKTNLTKNLFRSSMRKLHKLTSSSSISSAETSEKPKHQKTVPVKKQNTLTRFSNSPTISNEIHRKSSF